MRTAVKKWKRDDQKKFRQIRREAKALIKIKKSTIPPKLENLFLITLNACGPSSNLWQNRIAHLPFWEAANILYLTTKTKHTFWHNWFPLETAAPTTQANLFYHHTEVAKVLNNIDPAKAPGPDNISGRLLKETAPEISVSLCRPFNLSLSLGEFPDQWKPEHVCPVFKKDDPALAKNYRQISSLSILSKSFERCVFNHCYLHILPRLCHLQHGFLSGRSTVTQLVQVNHEVMVYLDFAKAFDKVPHSTVINKLSRFCISGQ